MSEIPDFTQKVIGHRKWKVDSHGNLFGTYRNFPWHRGTNVAICDFGAQFEHLRGREMASREKEDRPVPHSLAQLDSMMKSGQFNKEDIELFKDLLTDYNQIHHCPAVDCTCGFYSYWNQMIGKLHSDTSYINGCSLHWGEVLVHSSGLRSSKAQVAALVILPDNRRVESRIVLAQNMYDRKIAHWNASSPIERERGLVQKPKPLDEVKVLRQAKKGAEQEFVNALAAAAKYNIPLTFSIEQLNEAAHLAGGYHLPSSIIPKVQLANSPTTSVGFYGGSYNFDKDNVVPIRPPEKGYKALTEEEEKVKKLSYKERLAKLARDLLT